MQDDAQHNNETDDFLRSEAPLVRSMHCGRSSSNVDGSDTRALSTVVLRDSRSQKVVVMICVHSLKRRRPCGSFMAMRRQRGTGVLQAGSATAASCEEEEQEDEDEVCKPVMLGWCCIVEGAVLS